MCVLFLNKLLKFIIQSKKQCYYIYTWTAHLINNIKNKHKKLKSIRAGASGSPPYNRIRKYNQSRRARLAARLINNIMNKDKKIKSIKAGASGSPPLS